MIVYDNFEVLHIKKPVDRLNFFETSSANKNVLDLGSYDETAYSLKVDMGYWLFSRLENVCKSLVGIDIALPSDELCYKSAKIIKMDIYELKQKLNYSDIELITGGELIEHIHNPSSFLAFFKKEFPSHNLLLSTPNGLSFGNTLMALIRREVQHPDHLHVFTYKILNTLCKNAGFTEWEIIPYHFFATELKLKTKNRVKRSFIVLIEKFIRGVEWLFPLLSMGYLVKIKI
ncbi:MAG: methyltransferase domain-containing protein [Bacteroidetes bacterium]|nr:methyltransferase domain-containing protein [Bacteroidota bacterium]